MVTVSTTGDDDGLTWSITGGNTNGDGDENLPFAINSGTGAIVNDADDLDFETTTSTRSPSRPPTARPPTPRTSIPSPTSPRGHRHLGQPRRDHRLNDAVVAVSTTGDDESLTWSITNGNTDGDSDGGLPFAIGASTGAITVSDAGDLDFETTTNTLTVQATDGTTADTEDITITITDVAPTVADTSANLAETAPPAAVVTVSTGDDDGLTWSITGNTDGDNDGQAVRHRRQHRRHHRQRRRRPRLRDDHGTRSPSSHRRHPADTEDITITITDVGVTAQLTLLRVSQKAPLRTLLLSPYHPLGTTKDSRSITAGNTDGDSDGGTVRHRRLHGRDHRQRRRRPRLRDHHEYDLTVQATDGTTPDTEVITITITDVD